ncbi:hypothetical protein CEUSTIGMA_g3154.t1 [Chlamydomonas eustigma]|uniref:Uncharacterized protein n=1 Tax=Chlamydomonas eustigma TaxID=1157962 RepID=A0A250WY09_9CHLO|nr:hypothetical protein CEUSTIGMA_g3154.t1 [Chlamydomonas eustigma]|eukprot:GAX75711.1 hypothetical protein CEUSTIGMA_g3154.t1 [Chlamydomonas eustigma]
MFDTQAAELQKMQLVEAQAASRQHKETLLAHSTGLQAPGDVLKAPTHLIPDNLNSAINLLQSCPNSDDTLSHHQRQEEESAMLCPCPKLINSQSQVDSRPLLDASETGAVRVQEETKAQGESVVFQDKNVLPGPTENSDLKLEGNPSLQAHTYSNDDVDTLIAGLSAPVQEEVPEGSSAHAQERLTAEPSTSDEERLPTGPSAHAQNADIRELNQNSKALSDDPPSGTPTLSSKFCETAEVHLASTSHASCRSGIAEVIVKSEHDHPTLISSCTQNACDAAPGDSQPLEEVPTLPMTMSPEALQCCVELAMTVEEAFCDGVSATDTDTGVACPTYVTHHDPPNKPPSAVEHDAAAEDYDSGKHALDYETKTEAEVGGGPKINSGGRADKQRLHDDALLESYEDHGPDYVIQRDGKLSPRNDIIKLLIPDTSMLNGTEVDPNKLRCSQTVREQQCDPCGDNVEGNSCKAECTSEEECRSPSESHRDDDVLSLVQQGFAVQSGAGVLVADKLGGRTSGRRVQVNPTLNGRERWGLHVDPFFVAHHPWYIKPFSAKNTILRIQAKETKKRGR